MVNINDISKALTSSREISQMVKHCEGMTVIDYVGTKSMWCESLSDYLREHDKDITFVKKVILLGVDARRQGTREAVIHVFFPDAEVISYTSKWNEIDPLDIYVETPIVIHFATALGNIATDYLNRSEESYPIKRLVECTRTICAALVLGTENIPYIVSFVHTEDCRLPMEEDEVTSYCQERQNDLAKYKSALSDKEFFFHCLEEVKRGCEECCMDDRFGKSQLCPYAQAELAELYAQGKFVPISKELAHQWRIMSARQGYIPSQIVVAENVLTGNGCPQNYQSGLKQLKRLAYDGNQDCCRKIINYVETHDDIPKVVAAPWIIYLANAQDYNMAKKLADAFGNGDYGFPKNHTLRDKWLNVAAEAGDPELITAILQDSERDHKWAEALKWYRKLCKLNPETVDKEREQDIIIKMVKSDSSSPAERSQKGINYLTGSGVTKDAILANQYLTEAATDGYLGAQVKLCKEYYEGKNWPKDYKKVIYWGDKALEQGSKDIRFEVAYAYADRRSAEDLERSYLLYSELAAEGNSAAMNNLGCLYQRKEFARYDTKLALQWFMKSAARGSSVAMRNIGFCYKDANGVEQDYKEALSWFTKSANCSDSYAMRTIGDFYRDGLGVDVDADKAIQWYTKSMNSGDDEAIVQIGLLYEKGDIVEPNQALAVSYYRKAAEKGYPEAQYYLANMYIWGKGVEKSDESAKYWYRQAARQGYFSAQNKLREMGVDWLEKEDE